MTEFSIKRFLGKKVKKKYKLKLLDVILRTNLFRHNIFNFIELFYIINNESYDLTKDDIFVIFNVLKLGELYSNKNCKFYKFYKDVYCNYYFNISEKLIDASYLDQVMKLNINVIYSNIVNNIQLNFEKYLFRLLKTKIKVLLKEQIDYNNLVKKCSYYEFSVDADNKDIVLNLVSKLKKTKNNNGYDKNLLQELSSLIETKKTKKHKTKNNAFKDDIAEIKEYEKKTNISKTLIKKIITGEKNKNEVEKLDKNFKDIYIETLKFFDEQIIFDKFYKNLNSQPFQFIKIMIKINNYLEENNAKTFNVFPKSRNLIPKFVTFDASSLNVIFLKNKDHNCDGDKRKRLIYNEVFNFDSNMYMANKKYPFTGTIQTDGVSLVMLYTKDKEKKDKINQLKQQGKKQCNDKIKLITEEQNQLYNEKLNVYIKLNDNIIEEIEQLKKKIKKSYSKKLDLILTEKIIEQQKAEYDVAAVKTFIKIQIENEIKKYKKDFEVKRTEKEEKNKEASKEKIKQIIKNKKDLIKKLKEENKTDELKILKRENKEFYYIEDLTEKELEELKKNNKMYFDLGKSRLFYGLGSVENKDKFIKYTNKERKYNLRTPQHKHNIEKINKELKINEIHEKLSKTNTKSSNIEKLKSNLLLINAENKEKYDKYLDKRLRLEKAIAYIDKQKTEKNMIDKIVEQYDLKDKKELKNIVAIIGDWKGNNKLKNSESTLGTGMKRMFRKYFKCVYLVEETNSSKLNHITHEEMENLVVEIKSKNKKGETKVLHKRMHEVLTLKMDKKHISKPFYGNEKENIKVLQDGTEMVEVTRYIQRDKNAVLNFRYFVKYYFENKERPEKFRQMKQS